MIKDIGEIIPELAGIYFVGDDGVICSSYNGLLYPLTPRANNKGYLRVRLGTVGVKSKEYLVHRLVALMYIPNPEGLATVNHKNGDKSHNFVSNLEWLSHRDNVTHYNKRLR